MSHPGTLEAPARELTAKWTWTGIIVGLLAVQLCMSGVAIFLATGDPAQAIVPNYHKHALEWDQYAAAKKQSQALGWKWTVSIDPKGDVYGNRKVALELCDRAGQPLQNAEVTLSVWHHSRASEPMEVTLTPATDRPGVYEGNAVLRRSGLWHLDLHVKRNGQHFIDESEQDWKLK